MANRYNTSTSPQGQYQPGSNNLVLLNKLGITDLAEMNQLELELLDQLTEVLLTELLEGQILSAANLCEWHRRWLGNVYHWAGNYRSVNMGKGNFQFAAASLVPDLMQTFERKFLVPMACYEGMRLVGLPLAPTLEQCVIVDEFENKVESIRRLEAEIDLQLVEAKKNKQSILVSAFSGELH